MVSKLQSLATVMTTTLTFSAVEEFKFTTSPWASIDKIHETIGSQMGIDATSIEFVSSNVGPDGDTYIVVYKITEYNSVPLTNAETK
jgi:hypothetical protein